MSTVRTEREVTVEDVQCTLADLLGPKYHVTVASGSTLKVGRTGVIPSQVKIRRASGTTEFKVTTTGLIVSRIVQAVSLNPRVKRALERAYSRAETPV